MILVPNYNIYITDFSYSIKMIKDFTQKRFMYKIKMAHDENWLSSPIFFFQTLTKIKLFKNWSHIFERFTSATTILMTIMKCLCPRWPLICFNCQFNYKIFHISSKTERYFITLIVLNMTKMKVATCGGSAYHSRSLRYFCGVSFALLKLC